MAWRVTVQLRALACVVIVVIVRVLNLAVPIVYKHVVDKLSDVTSMTHPRGGEQPRTLPFSEVR